MVMGRFAAVLVVQAMMLACFTGDMSAVTDKEFQELSNLVRSQAAKIHELEQLKEKFRLLKIDVDTVAGQTLWLEGKVYSLKGTVSDHEARITNTEGDAEDLQKVNRSVSELEGKVETLEGIAADHETRITSAEDLQKVNSSVSELHERMETLEGTTADHKARNTSTDGGVEVTFGSSRQCELGYKGENCDVCDDVASYSGLYDGIQAKSMMLTFSGSECSTFIGTEINGLCKAAVISNGNIDRVKSRVTYTMTQPRSAGCNGGIFSMTADLDENWNLIKGKLNNGQTFYDIRH